MGFETLGAVFWLIGLICAFLLFLAPMVTFKKIISSKSTKEFSAIPYPLILLNCLVFMWYSLFSQGGFITFTVFVSGATLELIYVITFLIYAPKMEKRKIGAILALVLSLFAAIALLSVFVFYGIKFARIFCGLAAALSSLAMYVAPFSVMRMVMKTKSTEFMSFFLSLLMFLYAISWFIVGLFQTDLYIAVPSALGSVLGILQLVLYARYRNKAIDKYTGALDIKFSTGALDSGISQPDLELSKVSRI